MKNDVFAARPDPMQDLGSPMTDFQFTSTKISDHPDFMAGTGESLTNFANGPMDYVKQGYENLATQGSNFLADPSTYVQDGLKSIGNIPLVSEIMTTVTGGLDKFKKLFNADASGIVGAAKDKAKALTSLAAKENSEPIDKQGSELFVTLVNSEDSTELVVFDVSPSIGETRQANYEEVSIAHHPGSILRFRSSSARSWSVEAKLVSRTPEEAANNLRQLNLIRGWTMPYYGNSQKDKLGAPPDVLKFSAYGAQVIEEHPVVLESYNTSWPNDVDYIQTTYDSEAVPFPVLMTVSLTLKESWSPIEFSSFNLDDYKLGNLTKAFSVSQSARDSVSKEGLPKAAESKPTDEPVGEAWSDGGLQDEALRGS